MTTKIFFVAAFTKQLDLLQTATVHMTLKSYEVIICSRTIYADTSSQILFHMSCGHSSDLVCDQFLT